MMIVMIVRQDDNDNEDSIIRNYGVNNVGD